MKTNRLNQQKGLKALFYRFYVERQFYMRESGSVHFITLSPRLQTALAGALLGLLIWVAYTSMLALIQWRAVWTSHKNLVAVQSAYEERIATIQESHDARETLFVLARKQFEATIRDLEERHKQLSAFLRERTRVGEQIEKRRGSAYKSRLSKTKPKPQSYIFPSPNTEMSRLTSRPLGRKRSAVYASPERRLSLDPTYADRDFRYVFTRTPDHEMNTIPARLARVDTEQRAILALIDEDVSRSIVDYEHIIRSTEAIDLELFISRIANATRDSEKANALNPPNPETLRAQGGPFLPLAENSNGRVATQTAALVSRPGYYDTGNTPSVRDESDTLTAISTNHLKDRYAHLKALDRTLTELPLAPPLDTYYVSSRFGPRIDPFTQRWALHEGLDFATRTNSAIRSPLPGTILFAGTQRGFGKTIEINHGNGIITRYAHLKDILVEKGDTVVFREKIGIIGSSGRSTAEHLHYEIIINGKAYDPWKFLEAGKLVFETKN